MVVVQSDCTLPMSLLHPTPPIQLNIYIYRMSFSQFMVVYLVLAPVEILSFRFWCSVCYASLISP